jgi:hypothetical protein
MTDLPKTIVYSMQPYTNGAVVGDLEWATETERNWNGGPPHVRKVLRGKVISGTEVGFLFGRGTPRDITGQDVTIYGVQGWEIARREIVRIAG